MLVQLSMRPKLCVSHCTSISDLPLVRATTYLRNDPSILNPQYGTTFVNAPFSLYY